MKAWIMLIDPLRTSVFQMSSNRKEVTFSTIIKNALPIHSLSESKKISDSFAHYVAEEIEIACGCGTHIALILSGEIADVQKVCSCLSPATQSNIIGKTPKGYDPALWWEVLKHSASFEAPET